MEKILLFLGFLLIYGLFLASSAVLVNRFLVKVKPTSMIENEILIIVPYLFFFAFVFIIRHPKKLIRLAVLKYSLILLLGSYALTLPVLTGVLSSGFIDEDTRARYFINQFSGLIAYSLFISLLYWIFNSGSAPGHNVQLGNLSFSLSPQVILVLMLFLLVFLVLPYFIGVQKAKRLKNDYLETTK